MSLGSKGRPKVRILIKYKYSAIALRGRTI